MQWCDQTDCLIHEREKEKNKPKEEPDTRYYTETEANWTNLQDGIDGINSIVSEMDNGQIYFHIHDLDLTVPFVCLLCNHCKKINMKDLLMACAAKKILLK